MFVSSITGPSSEEEAAEEARWKAGLEELFALLGQRDGWVSTGGGWGYSPAMPPGGSPTATCHATEIDDCGMVYPPGVTCSYDESEPNVPLLTAAAVTGIEHPALGGEVSSMDFESPGALLAALPTIEGWRWPTNLPDRAFPGAVATFYDPGHPPDLDAVARVLDGRGRWNRQEEAFDGESLAQLWPVWWYLPDLHGRTRGRAPTRVRPDRFTGVGYSVWGPTGSGYLQFPSAADLLANLDAIEAWDAGTPLAWVKRGGYTKASCPTCGADQGAPCRPDAPGQYANLTHFERVPASALAPPANPAPRPGQRPTGRPRRRRR